MISAYAVLDKAMAKYKNRGPTCSPARTGRATEHDFKLEVLDVSLCVTECGSARWVCPLDI